MRAAERPEQAALCHRMLDAMLDGGIALCDAGTGIGKTYVYLVAGTVYSRFRAASGLDQQPILISTSSIALQNAVRDEYLPLLSSVLMEDGLTGQPIRAVIRKGKSHYVCDERLENRLGQLELSKKNWRSGAALLTLRGQLDTDEATHLSGYDRVLVKSISRFARNTKDCLSALRELMRLGVTVQFEKENIDTGTLTTELMVSVSGSLAQQESMSISQNIRMGYRRRMERGEFIASSPPYGYRNAGGGRLEIVPEEAEVIRWVFESYLNGQGIIAIAEEMNRRGVPKKHGESAWIPYAVACWLRNEKYTGNTLCQKTFTTGFPYVSVKNRGEVDQFYIENSHPAIISQEIFDKVQALRQMKKKQSKGPDAVYPLSRKMCCGICGFTIYRRMTRRGTGAWSCGRHLRSAANCPTGPIPEEDIYAAFLRMYNKLRLHDGIILRPALGQMEALGSAVQRENPAMLEINCAIAQATEQNYKISKLRSSGLLDADACAAKLAALDAQLTQLRAKRRKLLRNDDISEMTDALRQTVDAIRQGPERLDNFDEALFEELVEQIVVSPTALRFRLYGGIEVTERIGEDTK